MRKTSDEAPKPALNLFQGRLLWHALLLGFLLLLWGGDQGRAQELIAKYPFTAEEHYKEGIKFWDQGQFDLAENQFRTAIWIKPDYAVAHYRYGAALERREKWDDAVGAYLEAIRLKPDLPEAHQGLGSVYERKGWYGEAEFEYLEALKLNPSYIDALISMAQLLDKQKQRKEGRIYWEKAIAVEKEPGKIEKIKKRLAEPD